MIHSLLPPQLHLKAVCRALRERPEAIYLVGGYVRDWLMGRSSHDLDFAVQGEAIPLARDIADTALFRSTRSMIPDGRFSSTLAKWTMWISPACAAKIS
jgi:tRNA nucleotidyltransferase/poly(A) polymerase